jgi:hypothetical protein
MKVTDRRQTRPLIREGTPQRQHSNFQTDYNIWSRVPEWTWHHDILIDWSSVVTWLWLWLWLVKAHLRWKRNGLAIWESCLVGTSFHGFSVVSESAAHLSLKNYIIELFFFLNSYVLWMAVNIKFGTLGYLNHSWWLRMKGSIFWRVRGKMSRFWSDCTQDLDW